MQELRQNPGSNISSPAAISSSRIDSPAASASSSPLSTLVTPTRDLSVTTDRGHESDTAFIGRALARRDTAAQIRNTLSSKLTEWDNKIGPRFDTKTKDDPDTEALFLRGALGSFAVSAALNTSLVVAAAGGVTPAVLAIGVVGTAVGQVMAYGRAATPIDAAIMSSMLFTGFSSGNPLIALASFGGYPAVKGCAIWAFEKARDFLRGGADKVADNIRAQLPEHEQKAFDIYNQIRRDLDKSPPQDWDMGGIFPSTAEFLGGKFNSSMRKKEIEKRIDYHLRALV